MWRLNPYIASECEVSVAYLIIHTKSINQINNTMGESNKERFDKLIEAVNIDYEKFDSKGNKAAGTRCRKALSELGKLTRDLRAEIQERKGE